ncbi:hypothetical protein [Saccharomonospora piscinae]|nr:hypothetical protein [Saccharomonospora piscinae]
MSTPEPRPFQRLDGRLAGKPLDERVLTEQISGTLEQELRRWLASVLGLGGDLASNLAMALDVQTADDSDFTGILAYDTPTTELYVVVDGALQLRHVPRGVTSIDASELAELGRMLHYGRSIYRVNDDGDGLVYRVDPTAEQAFQDTATAAEQTTAALLRAAWQHAYKPDPDATTAYREAVRAVEQLACPLVLPNSPKPTLGTVIAHLRDAEHKWETVLVGKDGDPGGPQPVRELMERLWNGQVSRHGGSKQSRDQDQAEAEAAVHAAVLLVQWLSTGVLRKADA